MQPSSQLIVSKDEISLVELFSVLWKKKVFIILVTLVFASGSVALALQLPNIYRSQAVLNPNSDSSSSSLSSMAGNLGGLASLAGVDLGGGSDNKSVIAKATLESRSFIGTFILEHDIQVPLMAAKEWNHRTGELIIDNDIYNINSKQWVREVKPPKTPEPSAEELYLAFKELMVIGDDQKTGMVKISMDHISPMLAQQWNKWLIEDINSLIKQQDIREAKKSIEYIYTLLEKTHLSDMRQTFYQLIEEQTKTMMLAEVRDEYVYQIIDPPYLPEKKAKPSRAIICVGITFLGGILASLIVIFRYFLNDNRLETSSE